MKLKHIICELALCLPIVIESQAAITILDWQLSTGANPAAPTTTVNPSGATATALVDAGSGTGYVGGTFDPIFGAYGTPTGMWDTLNGQFQFTLNTQSTVPGATLDYTLQIDQWISADLFANPGTMQITPGGPTATRTAITGTGANPSEGGWYRDTFTWQVNPVSAPLTLTITPGAGSGGLLFDRVQWTISGDLAAVPEPMMVQSVAAGGLLVFGLWWRRRNA